MSYVVSIVRQNAESGESEIPLTEWRSLVESDPTLQIETDEDGVCVARWLPEDRQSPAFLRYSEGVIEIENPDDEAIKKLQAIAQPLNARLIGEEGEDLTDMEFQREAGCATVLSFVAAGAIGMFL